MSKLGNFMFSQSMNLYRYMDKHIDMTVLYNIKAMVFMENFHKSTQ